MEKPNFIPLFVVGKTDYFLTAYSFRQFFPRYARDGVAMTEQILNLQNSQKDALLEFLQKNLLPENIEYRYNFIFDNCTTRPRDIIEQFCGGTLIYPVQSQSVTFRQLIHQYTRKNRWLTFGIDCVIGNGADSLITYRNELFLPEKLMDALDHSVVKFADDEQQPIILHSKIILQNESQLPSEYFWNNPIVIGIIVFILYLALSFVGYKKNDHFRLPFALLFFIAGVGGCIVFILNFFSLHPCVQSNWNLLWIHPLHFIVFVGFLLRKSYQWIRWYHAANFVILSGFLLGWYWIPQVLNKACIPFILCLWIVSGLQLVKLIQKRK
jgi:hypothetical protein